MNRNKTKVWVVIPTIRNLDFLKSWGNEFAGCHLIIVEDNNQKTINSKNLQFASVAHFYHADIAKDFGQNSWIFSRKNAGIRSYGVWKAYQLGAKVIITLDDDCYMTEDNFVGKHLDNLNFKPMTNWVSTYPNPKWIYTRGIPYKIRDSMSVMLSHGLWSGAIDLDAKTEINLPQLLNLNPYPPMRQIIPNGYFYPMCSMNLAFKREIAVLMFFPMMGQKPDGSSWLYNRYDDIWAGLFSKKIMDHLGLGIVNGSPFVNHQKKSKASQNFINEREGLKINEILWKRVNEVKLTKNNPKACYIELANKINFPGDPYFRKLKEAMIIWANLF